MDETTVRELRIAPVMTGGTSLAVWMGGVTAELYALLRASVGDVGERTSVGTQYARLLALTNTRVRADVITGTSAGGLNGSLLAAAVAFDLPIDEFATMRTTWMDAADLDELLRSPSESDPPSLLRGDDYFLTYVRDVLGRWGTGRDWDAATPAPVDLVTTYTTVNPTGQRRADDFEEGIHERRYAGTLRFVSEHFRSADVLDKLAIASRTSASIPGVFEPSFLASTGPGEPTPVGRPDFAPHQPLDARGTGRWAVDGGLVVNLPLTEALDRIFAQQADRPVRRVILYVCPTPGGELPVTDDDLETPPSMRAAALVAISAPRAEGIIGDLEVIDRRNQAIDRQRALRRSLASFVDALAPALDRASSPGAPRTLYDLYRDRRTEKSVAFVVERRRAAGRPIADEAAFAEEMRSLRWALLPTTARAFDGGGREWGWGIAPIEEAGSVTLGLINRALDLATFRRRPDDGAGPPDVRAASDATVERLRHAKRAVHRALLALGTVRTLDAAYWLAADEFDERDPYAAWPIPRAADAALEARSERRRAAVFRMLLTCHRQIARALLRAAGDIRAIAVAAGGRTDEQTPTSRASQAQAILDELHVLVPATGTDLLRLRQQLLVLHVTTTLMLDDVVTREQSAELLQISWWAPNHLDPKRTPDAKLVGPELARLGAFLKPSWRANDWFWGRMDGAARLVRLLLEPARLHELAVSSGDVIRDLDLTDSVELRAELAALDEPTPDALPASFPLTTAQVVERLQLAIAAEELPLIAQAIDASSARGANQPDQGAFRDEVRRAFDTERPQGASAEWVPSPTRIKRLVRSLRIGSETAGSELGSSLTVRMLTRGAGVAVNMVTSPSSGLGVASRLVRPLRAPLHGINAVVGVLTGTSRLARGLTAFLLAVFGAIVAARLAGLAVSGSLVAVSTIIVLGCVGMALLRSGPKRLVIPLALLATPVALALVGGDLADVLYDGEAAVDPVAVAPGATLRFDDDVVVRVSDRSADDDALVEDLVLGAGDELTLQRGHGEVVREVADGHRTWWKRWLTDDGRSLLVVTRVALFAGLGALVARAVLPRLDGSASPARRARREWQRRWGPRAAAVGAGAVALLAQPVFEWAVTGTRPVDDDRLGVKGWLLRAAEWLATWQLPVLLLVIVGTVTLIALGGDIAWSRMVGRWTGRRGARH